MSQRNYPLNSAQIEYARILGRDVALFVCSLPVVSESEAIRLRYWSAIMRDQQEEALNAFVELGEYLDAEQPDQKRHVRFGVLAMRWGCMIQDHQENPGPSEDWTASDAFAWQFRTHWSYEQRRYRRLLS